MASTKGTSDHMLCKHAALAVALLPTFTIACGDEPRTPAGPTLPTDPPVTVEESGFTLSGTVSDGRPNGPVLAGAVVSIESGRSVTAGPDGRYEIRNLSGTVTVSAAASHYQPRTAEATMDADRTVDFVLEHAGIPPFEGTVFVTPDLFAPSDPTSLQGVMYAGRGDRLIYDRRPDAWIAVNAYLFRARYGGVELEFQVNPEFGSRESARAEVDAYAPGFGRMPAVLMSRLVYVTVNAGKELFGGTVGGSRPGGVIIHTGQGAEYMRDGFLDEVLFHEAAHAALDVDHATAAGWRAAQEADGVFISSYARDNPDREDIAESILPYFAVRYRPERLTGSERAAILTAIPNRLLYFDEQGFDMSPYHGATQSVAPVLGERWLQPRNWYPFEGPPTQ